MKKFFTLLLLFSGYIVFSQPIIQSSWFPTAGTTFNSAVVDTTNINEGPAGANQTWNFGMVTQQGMSQSTFVDPATTPFAASFPGANRSLSTSIGVDALYTYYNHSTSSTDLIGFGYSDSGSGLDLIMQYNDPQKQFEYPMTYNDQFTDNFAASYTIVFSGLTINSYRYGTIYTHADAWGTVITPSGTFNNSLRVKTRQVTTDSTVYVGSPPAEVTKSFITSYLWAGDTPGQLSLFQLSYDTIIDDQGNTTYGKDAGYQIITVGINEVDLRAENVNVYPNPASQFAYIDAGSLEAGEAILQVFDASGRRVKNQNVVVGDGTSKTIMLSTEEFKSGFYQLNITQKEKLLKAKFIKN